MLRSLVAADAGTRDREDDGGLDVEGRRAGVGRREAMGDAEVAREMREETGAREGDGVEDDDVCVGGGEEDVGATSMSSSSSRSSSSRS